MPRSRPPIAGLRASSIRTSARNPAPRRNSRPSTRPSRHCAILPSARPTTSCARAAIVPARRSGHRPVGSVAVRAGSRTSTSTRSSLAAGPVAAFPTSSRACSAASGARAVPVDRRRRAAPRTVSPAPNWRCRWNRSTTAPACASASTAAPLKCGFRRGSGPGSRSAWRGRAMAVATCCWKSNTRRTRSSRSTAATSSMCCRWRRGKRRWARRSACRPWAARWSSRSRPIPRRAASCACAGAACREARRARMATRSWSWRSSRRRRTTAPSARPTRACAMRSATTGERDRRRPGRHGERCRRRGVDSGGGDQAAGAPPRYCAISSDSSVSLNGLVM